MTAARTAAEWLERMREAQVSAVAAELGHEVAKPKGSSGGAVYGCPACGGDRRHTKSRDKRGAVGLERSGRGWRCFQCDAAGDAIDFIAYALRGRKFAELADTTSKAEVRDWCRRWLRLDGSPPGTATRRPPSPEPKREPVYLPEAEVRAVWDACTRVDEVPEVAAWLDSRRIDAIRVADADLARVVPSRLELPAWAGFEGKDGKPWRSWPSAGLRLVVPLYDREARMRSLIFRRPFETAEKWPPKSVAARAERAGLAMLCPLARQLLELGRWPEWWAEDADRRLRIAEGEMDFLTLATDAGGADETAPATIGGIAGSWGLLVHVPAQTALAVQTHADAPGTRYANEILDTVRERWRVGELELRLPAYFELAAGKVGLKK